MNKNNSSCLEVGVVLRYIGTTIEMNKDTIYKMIKMSPEYIYSGRLKELLRKSTEVSVRSVVEVKSEKTLKILSQFLVTGVLSVYSDWLINGCKESIDFIVDVTRTIAYGCLVQFIPQDKLKNIDLY
ncbi:MAG: TetR-like C-terminal domain-containing protein [Clostridia bacterium]|nr:TetR-like C-terminal domain-containing protein [Clostridia bacterium]